MATKALSLVTAQPLGLQLIALLEAMDKLRADIAEVVGDNQRIDLHLGKDGLSFDMIITLNVGDDGKVARYLLERQPLTGCRFANVSAWPIPHTVNRRAIRAQIVQPEGDAV